MKRTRLYWSVLLALTTVLTLVVGTLPAGADNLQNDVATATGITTITAGDSTTVTYRLIGNNAPSGDFGGCNATPSNPVIVTINRPVGVSGTPASLSLIACGNPGAQTATFSSSTPGDYLIKHSVSGGVSGSLFNNQANFTLHVDPVPPPPNTPPTLTLPSDQTVEATGPGGATVNYTASANDAEDGTLEPICSPASGSVFPLGVTQVDCSVTDNGGLSASGMFNITVVDTTPPTLHLPANITAEATGPSGAAVSFSATATDVVDVSVSVNCTHASGSTFALGTTTVSCTASDAHGNTASGSFDITVQDTTPPALHLPADITTQATGNSQAVVAYTATATDLVDGSVPVSCSPASGSAFPAGSTTVSCSATDAHNNPATGSFTVTVVYGWAGFFQPVDNLPTVNAVKAGSAIPVKFSLSGNQGLNIFKAGSPASASYACSGTAPTDAIEQTVTAGNSSLSYDSTTDQYVYVWKTDKGWAGSCRALVVKLADNTTKTANFQFTK
jgi:HYR domain